MRNTTLIIWFGALLLVGCEHDPLASGQSGSPLMRCKTRADCDHPDAVACSDDGYCLDEEGEPIPEEEEPQDAGGADAGGEQADASGGEGGTGGVGGTGGEGGDPGGDAGGTIVSIAECNEVREENAGALQTARDEWPDLTAANKARYEAALDESGLSPLPDERVVKLYGDGTPNLRCTGFEELTLKESGSDTVIDATQTQSGIEAGVVFEIVSVVPRDGYPESEKLEQGSQTYKYIVYVGTDFFDECGGPETLIQYGPYIPHRPQGANSEDGKTWLVESKPNRTVERTVTTCTVDDGNRCDAEPTVHHVVAFLQTADDFAGTKSLEYDETIIEVHQEVVRDYQW